VEVDAGKVTGAIRSRQQINNGPLPSRAGRYDPTAVYRKCASTNTGTMVRTHDFFGLFDIDARWSDPDAIGCAVSVLKRR
jgi:hypothetical protein